MNLGLGLGFIKTVKSIAVADPSKTYISFAVFGSSNAGGTQHINSSIFTNQIDTFDSTKEFRLSDLGVRETYSDPVNNHTGASPYTSLNEDMRYGPMAQLVKDLSAGTSKSIIVASGAESAVPYVSGGSRWTDRNAADPDDMTTRYGQVLTRIQELETFTGENLDFLIVPDPGRDAGVGNTASGVVNAMIQFCNDIRSDLGYNVPILVAGLGPTPDGFAFGTYTTWETIKTEMRSRLEQSVSNLRIIDDADDGNTLNGQLQWQLPWDSGTDTGTFQIGETLTGGTSGATGIVSLFNYGVRQVYVEDNLGTAFVDGEVVTGGTSGATATLDLSSGAVTVHYNTEGYNNRGSAYKTVLQEILITDDPVGAVDPDGANNPSTTDAIDNGVNGTITASSNFSGFPATNAVDGNATSGNQWISSTNANPQWLNYEFNSPIQINKYTVAVFTTNRGPTNFILQGSNTGVFGGEEVDLDTRSGVTWVSTVAQTFTFTNANTYTHYRLLVNETVNAGQYTDVAEWELIEAS